MEIREQIDKIVQKRSEKLPIIREKIKQLDQIQENLSQMETLRSQMLTSEGDVREESHFAPMLKKNPDMVWALQALDFELVRAASVHAQDALKAYEQRCDRKTVSISVVGKARCGKSQLLKAISGLNDNVIPAFDSTDCTGAPSIIYNEPGSRLKAHITFKSKDEMRRQAQTYLDRMIPDLGKRPLLHTMEDINTLNMVSIQEAVPMGAAEGVLVECLEKLVRHYGEWSAYAGYSGVLTLEKEEEIITFVAQNNGVPVGTCGREEYYKYLAVDTCEIECEFPQSEMGSIRLIDTVGLGDHTQGILDGMLETVKERSDAVIFNHMPTDGAGGGVSAEVVSVYEAIKNNCDDGSMDKWLFFFINHISKPTLQRADNTQHCESALKRIQSAKWAGANNARIIDATDPDSVRNDFLKPLLNALTENDTLDAIDESYRQHALEALRTLQVEYSSFCVRAQKVLNSDIRNNANLMPLVLRLTDEAMTKMRTVLFGIEMQWREKRDQPCVALDGRARQIFERMTRDKVQQEDSFLPSRPEILKKLSTFVPASTVYTDYADSIRNEISQSFLDVDIDLQKEIIEMKNELAIALYDGCGLKNVCPVPDDQTKAYMWLTDFSEAALGDGYPYIRLAIDTFASFEFSVKGFLTYEVRSSLDELNMRFQNMPALVNPADKGFEPHAQRIYANLHRVLIHLHSTLQEKMRELCIKPNCAMFAEISDFCDRICDSGGIELEWRTFLAENSSLLWPKELHQQQTIGILFQEWNDLIMHLQQFNKSATFAL